MVKSENTKSFWDKSATDYDGHMRDTKHYEAQAFLYTSLKSFFVSPIIDLACGSGFLSGLFLSDGHSVVLNDFSSVMIELSKLKLENYQKAKFSIQDATNFNSSTKFKTIVCCNLFFYIQNRPEAIKFWEKYLDTDGAVILFEEYPFKNPAYGKMEHHEKELSTFIDPISPERIQELFAENNFELIGKNFVKIDKDHNLYGFVFKKI